jgi:hypothetical protein
LKPPTGGRNAEEEMYASPTPGYQGLASIIVSDVRQRKSITDLVSYSSSLYCLSLMIKNMRVNHKENVNVN